MAPRYKRTYRSKKATSVAFLKRYLMSRQRTIAYSVAETKFWDQGYNLGAGGVYGAAITAGGSAPNEIISKIQQGTASNQRIGNRIRITKVTFAVRVAPLGVAMAGGASCRLLVWRYYMPVGAAPALGDVLNVDPQKTAIITPYSTRNSAVTAKLTVLADKMHTFTTTNVPTTITQGPLYAYEFSIYPKMTTIFNANTGGFADIVENSIAFAVTTEDGTCCTADVRVKILYKDA